MKIKTDGVVSVRSKIVDKGVKDGKEVSYFKLAICWSEWSETYKAERDFFDTVNVPEDVFNAVEEGDDIVLTGRCGWSQKSGRYYMFNGLEIGKGK